MERQPLYVSRGSDGMVAYVWASANGGYNVTLKDTDADEFLPTALHVDDYECAVNAADKWAPKEA